MEKALIQEIYIIFWIFYKTFPNILNAVSSKSKTLLSWTHYRTLFKEPVIEEMKKVNENQYLMNRLEFVKNPVIAEFLGYSLDSEFTETELETSIINNLQNFLMEHRKRICFCCKTTTYSYRKGRLLYWPCFL